VVGYERERDRFILRTGATRRQTLAAERFIATWQRGESWALIVLKPGELPADPAAVRYLQAVSGLEAAERWETAGASYEAAIVRWPDEPLAWFGLANVRLAQDRPREAESLYRQVLLRAADNVAARNNLALLLSRRGCPVQAQIEIERARIVATGTPFAAEVADSAAEIKSRGADTETADAPCVEP
jgi:tetratricopeptide (TPR) repeat protein